MAINYCRLMRALRHTALLFCLITPIADAADPPPRPRPISDAERQAVALAVAYFDAGAESWWQRLAADAPLRALGEEAALAEIRARLGPTAGASWWLGTPAESYGQETAVFTLQYPSGFDDTLLLELAPEDDWKIRRIATRVDPGSGAQLRLTPLLALRDALAEGRTDELERLFAATPAEGLRHVALLWESQYQLENLELERALDRYARAVDSRPDEPPPLYGLQQARLRLHQLDGVRTSIDYATAVEHGIDHDALRLEAVEAERLLGYLDEDAYQQLGQMGTRAAEVYYRLARTATFYKDPNAEELFRLAWQLAPAERSDVFSDPVLARLAVRPAIHKLLQLGVDREPLVAPPEAGRRALALPADARPRLLGSELVIALGAGQIVVPGGGVLAPAGTPSDDAAAARTRREEEALAQLDELARLAGSPGAFTNLRLRGRLETAAEALGKRQRWDDLLRLTEGMADKVTPKGGEWVITEATASLATSRALALMRAGRREDAATLLTTLVKHARAAKVKDLGPLAALAELCSELRWYRTAAELLRKADAELPSPIFSSRIQKLKLEHSIASSDNAVKSPNFRVRYTDALAQEQAINVARDLEGERERLRAWIPVPPGAPTVEVHLFPYQEFAAAYGYGTLGLFDGKMRIPFIDTANFQIVLSGVLSHELAHAMIKSATGELEAPHWFHEGLAQLLEMERGFDHPQRDEHDRRLALSVIETAFEDGRGADLVGLAYSESVWLLYFIQDKYGISGIRKLVKLFAQGKDSEAAVAEAFDLSLSDVYGLFDDWHQAKSGQLIATKQAARREWEAQQQQATKEDSTTTQDGRVIPKASFRMTVPPDTEEREELEAEIDRLVEAMLAWHRDYAAKSRGIKKSLRPMVETFRGRGRMPLGDACRQMVGDTRLLLADKEVFDCPDKRVGAPLRTAYSHFNLAGHACLEGKSALVQAELGKAEEKLTSVIYLLKPYGLAP